MTTTQIACLGLSHRSAPVSLRERISCALPDHDGLLAEGLPAQYQALQEIVVLSTCNRIELYAAVDEACAAPRQLLLDYLALHHSVNTESFYHYLYYFTGLEAAEHLSRVACGLDSQVLGEPQILGQVTNAYMRSIDARTIGPTLTTLFRSAISAGKRARAETAISSNPASIGSVSIALAEEIVGDLKESNVLVIGLGEMGQLALSSLRKRGVQRIALANRTLERAQTLAEAWNGPVYSLSDLPAALEQADVVISATAAPDIVIGRELMKITMAKRGGRDLAVIDIAVPRDVDPYVRQEPGVHLFNMDDLKGSMDEALAARRQEIPRVEAIIAEEMGDLKRSLQELRIKPLIADLRQKAEAIRQRELQRTLRFLGGDLDEDTLKHVQHLSRSLVNKLLHEPTLRLREQASNGQAEAYAEAVRDLFNLDSSTEG